MDEPGLTGRFVMLQDIVVPLVLLVNGLGAGVLVGANLGAYPMMAAQPAERYVQVHSFLATRYDPFMPVCLIGTVLGDLVLAASGASGYARVLQAGAAVLVASAVVISVTRNVPINRWVRSVDPDRMPADWQQRRRTWGVWNRTRGLLVVLALLANCVATALLL